MSAEWSGWVDEQWNPITGCFRKDCHWCKQRSNKLFNGDLRLYKNKGNYQIENGFYVLDEPILSEAGASIRQPFGFEPTYHRYRLSYLDKPKGNTTLLVSQAGEMFAPWVSEEYISEILTACKEHQRHSYLFRTTYPERYHVLSKKGMLPEGNNFWYGATVTQGFVTDRNTYLPARYHRFISVTPILGETVISGNVEWVIIGADTRKGQKRIVPDPKWIIDLVSGCREQGIPVFTEESADELIPEEYRQHDIPEKLQRAKEAASDHKWTGVCQRCKKIDQKTNMMAVMKRDKATHGTILLMYLCNKCFRKFTKEYGLEES